MTERLAPASFTVALTIAALLVGAKPVASSQSISPQVGVHISAHQVEQIAGNAGLVAIVTVSSMGQRSVSVRRVPSAEELMRRSPVALSRVTIKGPLLAYQDHEDVVLVDIASGRERKAWSPLKGERLATFCLTERALYVVANTASRQSFLQIAAVDTDAAPGVRRLGLATTAENVDLLCANQLAITHQQRSAIATVWQTGAEREVAVSGRRVVGLTDRYIYALAEPSHLSRYSLDGNNEWESVYQSTAGQIAPRVEIEGADRSTTLVETSHSNGATLVTTFSNGAEPVRQTLQADLSERPSDLWAIANGHLVTIGRQDGRFWLRPRVLPPDRQTPSLAIAEAGQLPPADRSRRSIGWLENQLGEPFPTANGVGRLIDSYEDAKRVGWTYDASIAVIALTSWERVAAAKELLVGLAHLQNPDGSWEFAYEPDRGRPIKGERYIGSIAWVVMAANFYEAETGDRTFAGMADRGLRFIDRFVMRDSASPLDGGVSMGPVAPQIFSTEHNVDALSAYHWRGVLSGRADHLETAKRVARFISRELWTREEGRPDGHFKVGARDSSLYLDAQTWTSLVASIAPELRDRLPEGLRAAERRLRVANGHLDGASNVVGFRDAETASANKVWSEGTEGMVAALLAAGEIELARRYHEQTERLQTDSGGIPYATTNDEGWPTVPSVAGTAWFLLNRAWPPRNPFAPDTADWLKAFGDRPRMGRSP